MGGRKGRYLPLLPDNGGEGTRGSSEIGRRFNPRDNGCERVVLHQQFPIPNKDHAGDDRPAISRIQPHGVFYLARIGEEREGRIRGRRVDG